VASRRSILREVLMKEGRTGVGDKYHQETKYRRDELLGGGLDWSHQPSLYKEDPPGMKRFPLRSPETQEGQAIWEVILRRRSFREFSTRAISLRDLSQLLWATQGITARAGGYDFRAVPSAGALYPIETYVLANRVDDLLPGIYHFDVQRAELALLKEGSFGREAVHAGLGQELLGAAAAVFIWTAIVERSKWKYRERAYRYIYMDAGHIGQNLYLAAAALDLGCCTVGAFFDEEVDRVVGVDGIEEISVYLGAVGHLS
jgi:SagB-type dehydrogenase family enzyme